jgi:hypothetical protein
MKDKILAVGQKIIEKEGAQPELFRLIESDFKIQKDFELSQRGRFVWADDEKTKVEFIKCPDGYVHVLRAPSSDEIQKDQE